MTQTQPDTPLGRATQAVETANRMAGSAERFKIGLLTPLTDTGWVVAGEMMVRGACLAADYVREHGGIGAGKQIELVLENDQATAAHQPMWRSAIGGLAKLAVEDDVAAVLGQWHVRTTPEVAKLAERLGIAHFVTTGHPEVTRQRYRTAFRTFFSTSDRARAMVRFMREQGAGRFAVIAADSAFGRVFADALETAASGACEVLRIDYPQETVREVRAELRRIKAWGPDFVVNLGIMVRMTAYDIINQAAEIGLLPDVPMLVGIPFPSASADFWKRVGANGRFLLWPTSPFRPGWPGLTSIGRWFVERYGTQYGSFPSEMALTAFTDVAIIAQALARARAPGRDALIESLESGAFDTWRGPVTFERGADDWHHSPAPVQLMQYRDVGERFEEAAIVHPPDLKTRDYVAPNALTVTS